MKFSKQSRHNIFVNLQIIPKYPFICPHNSRQTWTKLHPLTHTVYLSFPSNNFLSIKLFICLFPKLWCDWTVSCQTQRFYNREPWNNNASAVAVQCHQGLCARTELHVGTLHSFFPGWICSSKKLMVIVGFRVGYDLDDGVGNCLVLYSFRSTTCSTSRLRGGYKLNIDPVKSCCRTEKVKV